VRDQIRSAASLIVGRDGQDDLELLVLERSATSRFLPGYVAFPGGSVEEADAALAERWWGKSDEARRACALRELAEEAGLVMTGFGMMATGSLAALDDWPPRVERLIEIAHWIAPEQVPVRFDARFYAIEAPGGIEPTADGVETAHVWWGSPKALLEEWEAGKRKLYWPTYFTMTHLATCATVEDLLALRIETREPGDDDVDRLPRSIFWQE
jgi:8-oxo-dGTP pyrophosphatase MutT (NUDIX family)